jgi:membrane protease YdiL (CAAX protease family)
MIFIGGGALVGGVVYSGVPALTATGMDPLASWMLLSVPLVFVPVISSGCLLLRTENVRQPWTERLRLRRPTGKDWAWGVLGLVCIAAGSAVMMHLCFGLGLDPNPPFSRNLRPMVGSRLWMVGIWAVYWPINILGEEFVWRGVVLPRMQDRAGGHAWLLNAVLWGAFHLAFGLGNLLVLLPTLICVPLIAQRRRNTWLAVLMHAGLSGPGFVALALGLA